MNRIFLKLVRWFGLMSAICVSLFAASGAWATIPTTTKFIIFDNEDPYFTTTGTWSLEVNTNTNLRGPVYGYYAYSATAVTSGSPTATAIWDFKNRAAIATGNYAIDVFVPAALSANSDAHYTLQTDPACGTAWTNVTSWTLDQYSTANEGRFVRLVAYQPLTVGSCYRLVLSNFSTTGTSRVYANAVRVERMFESKATIPDMPFAVQMFAVATTVISSNSNAAPTIIGTPLSVTCPANGTIVVTGSGESTASSTRNGTAFMGLAHSISLNSTATDNGNVVQSSALGVYNGDTNRNFLNVQRLDTCTSGQTNVYRLTGYASTTDTSLGSFIWNGRLIAQFFPN
jgi:hypothetical protein